MNVIRSFDHQDAKLLRSLRARRKREDKELFVIEGKRIVKDALEALWPLELAAVGESLALTREGQEFLGELKNRNIKTRIVSDAVLAKISDTVTPQGIVAAARVRNWDRKTLLDRDPRPLWLFLDGIQDPGNAGTLIRTADAAGAGAVMAAIGAVDILNPKVIRSAMGSLFRIPFIQGVEPDEAVRDFASRKIPVFAASARKGIEYQKADFSRGGLIVVGNENRGLSPAFIGPETIPVSIPIREGVDSLNAAVSGSVILLHAALSLRESASEK